MRSSKPVQFLAEISTASVPEEYIQPCSLPSPVDFHDKDDEQVPIVDMNKLMSFSESTRAQALRELDEACSKWGAFQLINHGVPAEVIDGMKQAAEHFYKVPVEDKMKYFVTVFDARPMRYSTSFDTSRDKVLEWKDLLRIPADLPDGECGDGVWPDEEHLPREPVKRYSREINDMASTLLEAMSASLELPKDFLNEALASRERILVLNFYPPCPNPDRVIGLGAHSDATALTLLVQNDVDGIQLLHANEWVTVRMLPDAILVNLGDQLQILSNGKYHSVAHRALVNEQKLRISIATLCGPSKSALIQPAPQLVDEKHPQLYKPTLFQDYLLHYIRHGLNTRAALRHIENGTEARHVEHELNSATVSPSTSRPHIRKHDLCL